jgi:hypothetical protein
VRCDVHRPQAGGATALPRPFIDMCQSSQRAQFRVMVQAEKFATERRQCLARRDREWPLNEAQIPNVRGVREAHGVESCQGWGGRGEKRLRELPSSPT